jgi:hypothetical protein
LPAKATSRWRASPEPSSAAPVTGLIDECECEFEHVMKVDPRVKEAPRVTKPYTEEQWAAIEALGHLIDGTSKPTTTCA